jgi:hypothetical protein
MRQQRLTLTAQHLAFITVSGCSLNPARSLGPAVHVGGTAMQQLWLFPGGADSRGRGVGPAGQGEAARRMTCFLRSASGTRSPGSPRETGAFVQD